MQKFYCVRFVNFGKCVLTPPFPDFVSEIVRQGQPLCDGITVMFGPRKPLARFFLIADAVARRAGVHMRLHDDMSTLVAASNLVEKSRGPLAPILDPADSRLTSDISFWISAHNSAGELVGTIAGRLLVIGCAGLADEFRMLRIFYSHPEAHLESGTRCLVEGEAGAAGKLITGRVVYSGGGWLRPDFRRKGLAYLLALVVRNLAMTRWDPNYLVSAERGGLPPGYVPDGYSYGNLCSGISLHEPHRGDVALSLAWMSRCWMELELATYLIAFDQGAAPGTGRPRYG